MTAFDDIASIASGVAAVVALFQAGATLKAAHADREERTRDDYTRRLERLSELIEEINAAVELDTTHFPYGTATSVRSNS